MKNTMKEQEWIDATVTFMQDKFSVEGTGHDWWHIWRVWNAAKHIAEKEQNGNTTVIELAALLHDIADHKFHNGDHSVGAQKAREWLESISVDEEIIDAVCDIIPKVSYSGSGGKKNMTTIEGMIVQDADRIDAIGAIAVARVFQYGGHKARQIYIPKEDIAESAEERRAESGIQHFHDKLLKLRGLLNTESAKTIALSRHQYMQQYLQQFENEWYGRDFDR